MLVNEYTTVSHGDYVDFNIVKNRKTYTVIIDIEDIDRLKGISWYINNKGYCIAKLKDKEIRLHNFLLNRNTDNFKIVCDHINGNKLDNRKSNLRIVSQSVNCKNRACRGYSFDKHSGKYSPYITVNRKCIRLGLCDTEEEAIAARIAAVNRYYNS